METITDYDIVPFLLFVDIVSHAHKLLNFVFENVVVQPHLIAEQRDNNSCFKVQELVTCVF
jgi:hypothetical protein